MLILSASSEAKVNFSTVFCSDYFFVFCYFPKYFKALCLSYLSEQTIHFSLYLLNRYLII